MAEKKHSAFALLSIMTEYTDEDHILSTKELLELLEEKYDLKLERRTLYSNIDILEQAGFVINRYEDNGKGYFLEEKQFDKGEVLLLCNAIHASHFISDKQSNNLIKKLLTTQSKYNAKEFKNKIYMPNSLKISNMELLYNLSLISEAIANKKCIEFTYMTYDVNKHLKKRRDESYIVEPRYIVYADSRPYLIATNKKYFDYTHYRIDKISKAFPLEDDIKPLPRDVDAYEYAKNKLFMFAGKMETIEFLCHQRIVDQMIDIFGTEVFISPRKDEYFLLRVNTSKKGAMYLAQQFMDSIEIVKPKELREEFKIQLKKVIKNYNK